MSKVVAIRDGFKFRAMHCVTCGEKIVHPVDEQEYKKFKTLKNKEFRVKMRLVGNSYAVSIPREIVSFMEAQESIMNDMVRLCFEESGRLSLSFGNEELDQKIKRRLG